MHSGVIGKVEKAHRYAAERDRFDVRSLSVVVRGDNDAHTVELADGRWRCGCDFFAHHELCAHTMALELMLSGMVPRGAVSSASSAA